MRSFSPSFRDRHEEEMLDTLLEQRFEQTPTERLGGDIDLVRNGLAQRLGAATIEDLRAAVRVSSLLSLVASIGLSIVLLTRLQDWGGPTLTHPWPKVVWLAVLSSAAGTLFLPRALARVAWLGGVGACIAAYVYALNLPRELPRLGSPTNLSLHIDSVVESAAAPGSPISLSTTVLVVGVLLALGGWARSTSLPARTGAAAAGTVVGVGLVLRVDALLHAPSSGAISAAYFDQVHADFRLDLLHLDLAPGFGALAVGSLLALALAGWFHSRAAAIALTLIVPISIVAVATHSLRSVPLRWTLIADLVVAAIAVAALGRGSRSSRMSFDRRQP
jgi:hypothetical protein